MEENNHVCRPFQAFVRIYRRIFICFALSKKLNLKKNCFYLFSVEFAQMGSNFLQNSPFFPFYIFFSDNQYIIYSSNLREYLDVIFLWEQIIFQSSSQVVSLSSTGPYKETRVCCTDIHHKKWTHLLNCLTQNKQNIICQRIRKPSFYKKIKKKTEHNVTMLE